MSLPLGLILLAIVFSAGAAFWSWHTTPRESVPPHLQDIDLRRLETEDRLRQTRYQLLAGSALVLTFCLTLYQAATSYNQWNSDFALRVRQTEVNHLSEALKALSLEHNPQARIAGYYSLKQLAARNPEDDSQLASDVLVYSVRSIANRRDPFTSAGISRECGGMKYSQLDREDADPEVQVALNILGSPDATTYLRNLQFDGRQCRQKDSAKPDSPINLSHLALDNLDLGRADFSCVNFSQSRLRRTNFREAKLQEANFAGARFDDWGTPGFSEEMESQEPDATGTNRAEWLHIKTLSWRRYRCWIADFRGANLTNADFSGAGLAGVDFGGAILHGATFDGAAISRANFRKAQVSPDQLKRACADEMPLVDFGVVIQPCRR